MDRAEVTQADEECREPLPEQRSAPRYSLLIRPAKLVCGDKEFICVLRDVSRAGVSLRMFHPLPMCENYTLELQSGQAYDMRRVWLRDNEAGFEFCESVIVTDVISETSRFPKRALRLGLRFPLTVRTHSKAAFAFAENISQQGARIRCGELLAIDQTLRLASEGLPETQAKVRWRSGSRYGVVFEDTYSLRDFSLLAAQLQSPELLKCG